MQDQKFLKYRSLILRCVAASLFMAEDFHPTKTQNDNHTLTENGGSSSSDHRFVETLVNNPDTTIWGFSFFEILEDFQIHH